ncbi:MAG: ABC transporter permease [Fimbriimonadaceae bacterium]|nr:ABC transporter permease [Fimbriimonadaceae bacterium]
MTAWRHLVTENPMLVEIRRAQQRFLGRTRAGGQIALYLVGAVYVVAAGVVVRYAQYIDAVWLVYFQTFLFAFIGPSVSHGAVSGEREKRTWDMLVAAPVTAGQIVWGKYLGGCVLILLVAALFLPMLGVTYFSYEVNPYMWGDQYRRYTFWDLVMMDGISITFGFFAAALTLLFSARTKRAFVTLGIALVAMFVVLVLYPLFLNATRFVGAESVILLYFHPFVTIGVLADPHDPGLEFAAREWIGLPQIAINLALSVGAVVWAEKTLHFADGDVKFIPRKPHA